MRHLDDIVRAVADMMKIDAEQAERRKAFLQIADRDHELLRNLHERLGRERLDFVDELCEHLLAFDETRRFIEDPATLERLKRTQVAYFERLTAGIYDWSYVADRLRFGVAYQRVGLQPQWYLGSYQVYLRWLLPAVWRLYPGEPQRALDTFQALLKVVFLDMVLAIDTYIHADRQALVATKAYAEKVLATVPSGLLVLREDLRVVLVNRPYQEAFAVASEDVVGRLVTDVLPVDGLGEQALEVMRTGESRYSLPFELRSPEGEVRPLRITIAVIRLAEEEEEEEEELLLVVEDLTDEERLRAQARAARERVATMARLAPVAIVEVCPAGRVEVANETAVRWLGGPSGGIEGRPLASLLHKGGDDAFETWCARSRAGEPTDPLQVEIPAEDGPRALSWYGSPFASGPSSEEPCLLAVGVDLSRELALTRQLEDAQQSFVALVEKSPEGILVLDDERGWCATPTPSHGGCWACRRAWPSAAPWSLASTPRSTSSGGAWPSFAPTGPNGSPSRPPWSSSAT